MATWSVAFAGRPNISLQLTVNTSANSSLNQTTVSWSLAMVETASQPSYNLNTTNTASVSISFVNGSYLKSGSLPSIANYSYDFSASGLQTKTLGSGSFVVGHSV